MKQPPERYEASAGIVQPADPKRVDGPNATDERSSEPSLARRLLFQYRTELAILATMILLELGVGAIAHQAWTGGNLINIAQAAAPLVLMAFGELLVVITGGIDLSVGSVFSLCGMVTASLMVNHVDPVSSTLVALLVGVTVGAFNGFFVAFVGLAPFVVTLVSYAAVGSLAYVVTSGNSLPIPDASYAMIDQGYLIPKIPNYILCSAIGLAAIELLLNRAVIGRWVYAIGSNKDAAHLLGVPVKAVTLAVYTASGLLSACGAILSVSYLANAEATSGSGLMLQAIAGVVIGGASLFGGVGSAIGALFGALIITEIQNGVNLIGINTFWEGAVTGFVILVAAVLDRFTKRRSSNL